MKKYIFFIYSVVSYLAFLASFTYLAGFLTNVIVPKGIDDGSSQPLFNSILINVGLICLFGLQHSIMARDWFKEWWTKFVPKPIERSTFVLATSMVLGVLYVFWQPIGGVVWEVSHPFAIGVLYALYLLGLCIVLASSFLINHFDLFGLRQGWLYLRGIPYTPPKFRSPIFYNFVRHPLYFGILIAFWAAPVMTYSRIFFAILFTIYTLKAIDWEESDLIRDFGESYRSYRERVPKIIPSFRIKRKQGSVYRTLTKKEEVLR